MLNDLRNFFAGFFFIGGIGGFIMLAVGAGSIPEPLLVVGGTIFMIIGYGLATKRK